MTEKCPACGEPKNPLWFVVFRALMAWMGVIYCGRIMGLLLRWLIDGSGF